MFVVLSITWLQWVPRLHNSEGTIYMSILAAQPWRHADLDLDVHIAYGGPRKSSGAS